MKRLILLILLLSLFAPLFSQEASQDNAVKIAVLKSPSSLPVAYMMEKNPVLNNIEISYKAFADSQSLIKELLSGNIDISLMNLTLASKVYDFSNKKIVCCAISQKDCLYLISKDKSVKRFSDLPGKTINVAGKNITCDYIFRYLLDKNEIKIDKKGVQLDYRYSNSTMLSELIADKIKYALLSEPYVTIAKKKSKDILTSIDLQEEYSFFAGDKEGYPLTVIVARSSFAKNNKFSLDIILSAYEEAYLQTIKNPLYTGRLVEKYNLGLESGIAASAIPDLSFTYIAGQDMQPQVEKILTLFADFNTEAEEIKIPDSDFYYLP